MAQPGLVAPQPCRSRPAAARGPAGDKGGTEQPRPPAPHSTQRSRADLQRGQGPSPWSQHPPSALPAPQRDRAVVGHKPRPARSLDPCREPDLFTPFQRAGCVSGTAPASPSWRRRQDLGAEHRKPRLPPRSTRRRGWRGERRGWEGGKRVAAAHFHSKRAKGTPSHRPPGSCIPHPTRSQENVWGCLQHEFGPTGVGSRVQQSHDSAGRQRRPPPAPGSR